MAPASLAALRELSARIGRDPLLVQAGGGNTSIKEDGVLWVKASGKWLIRAAEEEMFVPAPLHELHTCIRENRDYVAEYPVSTGMALRPSVETTMHALLPHYAVIHVHSVHTLVLAIRPDGPAVAERLLGGLRWAWIPYIHPGLPLTRRIAEYLDAKPDILILGNHGLVVGGDSCAEAEELLHEVERRLAASPRPVNAASTERLSELARNSDWTLAPDWAHALGADPATLRIASGGTMYPDHCVYLGPSAAAAYMNESLAEAEARYLAEHGRRPEALLVEGAGVLVRKGITAAAMEMLRCLAEVAQRVDPAAPRQYLTDAQVAALVNWDAEKYRIALAREAAERANSPLPS